MLSVMSRLFGGMGCFIVALYLLGNAPGQLRILGGYNAANEWVAAPWYAISFLTIVVAAAFGMLCFAGYLLIRAAGKAAEQHS